MSLISLEDTAPYVGLNILSGNQMVSRTIHVLFIEKALVITLLNPFNAGTNL